MVVIVLGRWAERLIVNVKVLAHLGSICHGSDRVVSSLFSWPWDHRRVARIIDDYFMLSKRGFYRGHGVWVKSTAGTTFALAVGHLEKCQTTIGTS